MSETLRAGIVGAAGYTGAELLRLITDHPKLDLCWVAARDNAGKQLADVLPHTRGVAGIGDMTLESFDPAQAGKLKSRIDVAFSALPHGASANICDSLLKAGIRVLDLSADFRLKDLGTYEAWYNKHPVPGRISEAVYGQPELHRDELAGARLIAVPGCYPTSAILPLSPLLEEKLVESDGIIIDSKSGVSGAGKSPKRGSHYPETAEGLRPYGVAGTHRHTPEIEQELSRAAGTAVEVIFTPQLLPMTRGILTIAYAKALPGVTAEQCRQAASKRYPGALITVLQDEQLPDTLWVRGSARAQIAYAMDPRSQTVISMCVIDNLARGASAQAIQALIGSMGWAEELGLPTLAMFP